MNFLLLTFYHLILCLFKFVRAPTNINPCFLNHLDESCIRLIQLARNISSAEVYQLFHTIKSDLIPRGFITSFHTSPFEPLNVAAACLAAKAFPHNADCASCYQCKLVKGERLCNFFCPPASATSTAVPTSPTPTATPDAAHNGSQASHFTPENISSATESFSTQNGSFVVGLIFSAFIVFLIVACVCLCGYWWGKICLLHTTSIKK